MPKRIRKGEAQKRGREADSKKIKEARGPKKELGRKTKREKEGT